MKRFLLGCAVAAVINCLVQAPTILMESADHRLEYTSIVLGIVIGIWVATVMVRRR